MPTGVLLLWALAGWAGPTRFARPSGCAPRASVYLASSEPVRAVPNPVQAEAIRTPEKAVLVLASAGTGKTRVLRTRMAWLLLRQKVPSRNILAVTFSQHAALQLQARVAAVAGNAADGAWLGTFHSVCWRMLRENHRYLSLPPDFTVAAEADQMRLIDEAYAARVQSRAAEKRGDSEQGQGGAAAEQSGWGSTGASSGPASGALSAVERLVAAAGIDPVSAPAHGSPSRPEGRSLPRQRAAEVLHFILNWKERGITPEDLGHGRPPRSRFGADPRQPDAAAVPAVLSDAEALAISLYPPYQLALRAHGMLDFSDLTLTTLKLFDRHPAVLDAYRRQFHHVLVDELQDTSYVQFEWLRRLSGMPAAGAGSEGQAGAGREGLAPAVFCVADDDQSVYGWRGAERANVLRFTLEFAGVKTIRMTTSYRCAPHALAAAQAMLRSNAPSLVPKTCVPFIPVETAPRVVLRAFWQSKAETDWIASSIAAQHEAGLAYSDMAVLVRTQELVAQLAPVLRAHGIPVAIALPPSLPWHRLGEVRTALAALRLLRSSADDEAARTVLAQWAGLPAAALDAAQAEARGARRSLMFIVSMQAAERRLASAHAAPAVTRLLQRIAWWQQLAAGDVGLLRLLDVIFDDYPAPTQEGAAAASKLLRLCERCGSLALLLSHFETLDKGGRAHRAGAAGVGASASARGVHSGGVNGAVRGGVSGGTHSEFGQVCEEDAVQVLTVHRAKGLEWEVVFLPAWEEGTFPQPAYGSSARPPSAAPPPPAPSQSQLAPGTGAAGSILAAAAAAPEAEQEEWRLAYVALTRCRRMASVSYVSRRQVLGRWVPRSPSRFIAALPDAHVASDAPSWADPKMRGNQGFRASTSGLLFPNRQPRATAPGRSPAPPPYQPAWQEAPADLLAFPEAARRAEARVHSARSAEGREYAAAAAAAAEAARGLTLLPDGDDVGMEQDASLYWSEALEPIDRVGASSSSPARSASSPLAEKGPHAAAASTGWPAADMSHADRPWQSTGAPAALSVLPASSSSSQSVHTAAAPQPPSSAPSPPPRLTHRSLPEPTPPAAHTRRGRQRRTLRFAWGEADPEDEETEGDEEYRAELTFFWAGAKRMGRRRIDTELVFGWAEPGEKDVARAGSPPPVGMRHTESSDGRGRARAAVRVRRDAWTVQPSRQPSAPIPARATSGREMRRPADAPARFSPRVQPGSSTVESPDLQAAAVLQELVASVANMLC